MIRKATCAGIALLVILWVIPSAAEPLRVAHNATCKNDHGVIVVPAGTVLVPPAEWVAMDVEKRRLERAETRLTAENKSLRASATERATWPSVALLTAAVSAGIGIGALWGR